MKSIKMIIATVFLLIVVSTSFAQLPNPGMTIDPQRTAIVITDPQNDFLSLLVNVNRSRMQFRVLFDAIWYNT